MFNLASFSAVVAGDTAVQQKMSLKNLMYSEFIYLQL